MREVYQSLYDNRTKHYGEAAHNMCPGVRYLPRFEHWLKPPVVDFGCGNGDTIKAIKNKSIECYGVDWISNSEAKFINIVQHDITKPISMGQRSRGGTAICIDVFEHIDDLGLEGLMANMQRFDRQVITVFSGSHIMNGVELHINIKEIAEWTELIAKNFQVLTAEELDAPNRRLYLCKRLDPSTRGPTF